MKALERFSICVSWSCNRSMRPLLWAANIEIERRPHWKCKEYWLFLKMKWRLKTAVVSVWNISMKINVSHHQQEEMPNILFSFSVFSHRMPHRQLKRAMWEKRRVDWWAWYVALWRRRMVCRLCVMMRMAWFIIYLSSSNAKSWFHVIASTKQLSAILILRRQYYCSAANQKHFSIVKRHQCSRDIEL